MAKHYSGKRVAGRKPVGKRALSLLMALVMSLSLVQITAFAVDEGETTFENQVMEGWFTADDGTANTGVTNDKGFTLSKTIEQTGVNAFDITLTVETTQTVTTSDAAVQLIIDTSGSMKYCAVCGVDMRYYYHHERDCTNKKAEKTRLDATKAAVADQGGFLDQLLAGNKSGGKIWVSVVEFASGAYTVCDWTDIRTSKGLQDVKKAVNDLEAGGGTNLEAGLMLARNRLSMDEVKNAASKYTVLLTDGEPTYRVKKDFPNTDKIDKDTTSDGSGSSCSEAERNEAKTMATQVKALSKLYTICYSVSGDVLYGVDKCEHCDKTQKEHEEVWYPFYGSVYYCGDNSGNTYKSTAVTIGDYLRDEIATPAVTVDGKTTNYAFNANETEAVNNAFKNIATSAVEGMNGAGTYVTDPMGAFINLTEDAKAKLAAISGVSVDGSTIKWNLNPENAKKTEGEGGAVTYQYTLTYSITLDTAARGFESNTNYPTNGRTFLTIPAEEGAASEVDFNIPGVFGKVPQVEYTVNYFYQSETADADGNREYVQDNDATVNEKADLWSQITVADKAKENYINNANKEGATPALSSQVVTENGCVFNVYYDWNEPQQPDPYTVTVYYVEQGVKTHELAESQSTEVQGGESYDVTSFDKATITTEDDTVWEKSGIEGSLTGSSDTDVVIYIFYTQKQPELKLGYYVLHEYFVEGAAKAELRVVNFVEVEEAGPVTLDDVAQVLNPVNGKSYTYKYGTPEEGIVVEPVTDDADYQQITLHYERTAKVDPTYAGVTVIHEYYYKTMTGAAENTVTKTYSNQQVGKSFTADRILNDSGKTYVFQSANPAETITVNAEAKNNVITMKYLRVDSEPIITPPTSYDYYTVTVNYYDKASGEAIHTAYTTRQREYTSYDVTAQDKIAIEGYTYVETSGDALTGTLNGNKVINVYYSKTTDIDDGDTPTTPADPGTDIEEPDVPVSPAQPPKTGDSMGLWIAAALVSGMGLVWLALSGKKREERA